MKFAKLSIMIAAASLAFGSVAIAAPATGTTQQKYSAEMIKQICADKKDPAKCAARRKVGDPVSTRDLNTLNKPAAKSK